MAKLKALISLLIPILLATGVSLTLQKWILHDPTQFPRWLANYGNYIILAYIPLQALTLIIPPLGGFFLVVAMITLFGPELAVILMYLVSVPCYTLNFLLAKKYGRPLVQKVIDKNTLDKIDHFVGDAGIVALIALRTFQGGNFDYLSYGFGLTKTRLNEFFLVNVFAGLASSFIFYLIFKYSSNINMGIILSYLVGFLLTGVSLVTNHFFRKHKREL